MVGGLVNNPQVNAQYAGYGAQPKVLPTIRFDALRAFFRDTDTSNRPEIRNGTMDPKILSGLPYSQLMGLNIQDRYIEVIKTRNTPKAYSLDRDNKCSLVRDVTNWEELVKENPILELDAYFSSINYATNCRKGYYIVEIFTIRYPVEDRNAIVRILRHNATARYNTHRSKQVLLEIADAYEQKQISSTEGYIRLGFLTFIPEAELDETKHLFIPGPDILLTRVLESMPLNPVSADAEALNLTMQQEQNKFDTVITLRSFNNSGNNVFKNYINLNGAPVEINTQVNPGVADGLYVSIRNFTNAYEYFVPKEEFEAKKVFLSREEANTNGNDKSILDNLKYTTETLKLEMDKEKLAFDKERIRLEKEILELKTQHDKERLEAEKEKMALEKERHAKQHEIDSRTIDYNHSKLDHGTSEMILKTVQAINQTQWSMQKMEFEKQMLSIQQEMAKQKAQFEQFTQQFAAQQQYAKYQMDMDRHDMQMDQMYAAQELDWDKHNRQMRLLDREHEHRMYEYDYKHQLDQEARYEKHRQNKSKSALDITKTALTVFAKYL